VLRDHGTSAADVDLVKTLPSYFVVLSVIFGKVLDLPSVTLIIVSIYRFSLFADSQKYNTRQSHGYTSTLNFLVVTSPGDTES
jgi:hypothetical protein